MPARGEIELGRSCTARFFTRPQQVRHDRKSRLMSARYRMRPLSPGGRVQIVAPSGPFDVADFERGVELLRARYDVRYAPHITERAGYLAGSDARRKDELLAAIEDPEIDAIVTAR